MSNEAYAAWKETAQCKMGLYGACSAGDKTIVTQFKDPSQVTQLFLSPKGKAGRVMAEGALTLIAGVIAIGITANPLAIMTILPAIMTTLVGVAKFARGLLMWGDNKPEGGKLAIIDALRGVEAAAAVLGAVHLGPSPLTKIPLLVFGIAKVVRSLATAITDWLGEDTDHTIIRKGLMYLASLAHYLEHYALTAASFGMYAEGGVKIAGGVAMSLVAISKRTRAADQLESAVE